MRRTLGRLAVASLAFVFPSIALAEIPGDTVDLDRVVAFSQLRPVTVYKAYSNDHLYYVVRAGLHVIDGPEGPMATLLYRTQATDRSFLSLRLVTDEEPKQIGEAIDEIKGRDQEARFAYIEPTSFEYIVSTPGSAGGTSRVEQTPVLGDRGTELLISVDPILKRILLIPTSYQFVVLSIVARTHISGVVRSADGTPAIGSREIDLSTVASGSCALAPEQYINVDTGQTGCNHPRYPEMLVHSVQNQLIRLRLMKTADGTFGPITERAIRDCQHRLNVIVDGIPSVSLLEGLSSLPTPALSQRRAHV